MPESIVEFPQQNRSASFVPATVNDETRTVDLTFSTGAKVQRFSPFEGRYLEELSLESGAVRMDRLNNGAPLLDSHDSRSLDCVVGVVERAVIQGGQGIATVRFAKDDERADKIWKKVRDGILPNISIGYHVHEFEERREGDKRIMRATDWEPIEISFVAIPADHQAQVRDNSNVSACVVRTLEEDAMTVETTTEEEKPEVVPAQETRSAPAPSIDIDKLVLEAEKRGYEAGRKDAADIASTAFLARRSGAALLELMKPGVTPEQARAALVKSVAESDEVEIDNAAPLPTAEQRSEAIMPSIDTAKLYAKRNGSAV